MADTGVVRIPIGLDISDVESDAKDMVSKVKSAFSSDILKKPTKEAQQLAFSMKQTVLTAEDLSSELEKVKNKKIPTETYWQTAVNMWNLNNSSMDLPFDLKQPDYSRL